MAKHPSRSEMPGLILFIGAAAGILILMFLTPRSPLRQPQSPPRVDVLLNHAAPLRTDGTELAFTVRQPSIVRVWMTLPEGRTASIRFGVPAPAEKADFAYRPLAEREIVFEVTGAAAKPFKRTVMAVGTYILRVDAIRDLPAGATVHARVIAEPVLRE